METFCKCNLANALLVTKEHLIVCTNAPIHSQAVTALKAAMTLLFDFNRPFTVRILCFAPYSPLLNLIKSLWTAMKSKAEIELLVHQEILDKPDTNETITKH